MTFELSRDYKRAFELIKKGDRLACLVDYSRCRDIAIARLLQNKEITIGARGISYLYFFEDQIEDDQMFVEQCTSLNVEFYLPIQGETA